MGKAKNANVPQKETASKKVVAAKKKVKESKKKDEVEDAATVVDGSSPVAGPVTAIAGKKRTHRKAALKYKTTLKRLCKVLKVPQLNKDAMQIANGAIESFLSSLLQHLANMYADTNKTLTQKSVRLAFIAQMEKQGVLVGTSKGALERADAAIVALAASLVAGGGEGGEKKE